MLFTLEYWPCFMAQCLNDGGFISLAFTRMTLCRSFGPSFIVRRWFISVDDQWRQDVDRLLNISHNQCLVSSYQTQK